MTPTRWLIVAFWAVMLLIGAGYVVQSILAPPPPSVPQKQWLPPPLPSSTPAPSPNADVRMTQYAVKKDPNGVSFSADVTIKNFGQKKATGIQVKIQPYTGNTDTIKSQPGPDEMPAQPAGDPMANIVQWVSFPDLGPGESSTQTLSFTMRSDADPALLQSNPQVEFQTVP